MYSYTAIPAQTGKHKQYFTNKQNYYLFKDLLVRSRNCAFEDICPKVQIKLVQYLTSLDEQHAATWFENNWTGDRGRWMLGYLGINAAITNNGLESTWKQLKKRCSYRQGTTHLHQFIPAMFWFLEDRTMFARDRMEEQGDPHNFMSAPTIRRMVDAAMKYRSLLTTPSYIADLDIHQVLEILESFHQVKVLRHP